LYTNFKIKINDKVNKNIFDWINIDFDEPDKQIMEPSLLLLLLLLVLSNCVVVVVSNGLVLDRVDVVVVWGPEKVVVELLDVVVENDEPDLEVVEVVLVKVVDLKVVVEAKMLVVDEIVVVLLVVDVVVVVLVEAVRVVVVVDELVVAIGVVVINCGFWQRVFWLMAPICAGSILKKLILYL